MKMRIGILIKYEDTDIGVVVGIEGDHAYVRLCPLLEHKVSLINQSDLKVIEYYKTLAHIQ